MRKYVNMFEFDRKKILQRMDREEDEKKKIDELFNTKHRLFEFLHFRLKTLVNLETSQKLGWYKRRWGNEIKQFYYTKDSKVIGDLDKIRKKLSNELIKVQNLSNKDFKRRFGK
tara:strand:+ start:339 stop:680 length:342 start_codon:yes stop_codon:yes gene_type:complete